MAGQGQQLVKIGVGGGCHWCTEAVFQALIGVEKVEQGFIAALSPDDEFSEAVLVHFDPSIMPVEVLLDIHLRTHASTSNHKMRGKYRSAVYVFDAAQEHDAHTILEGLQEDFEDPLVTRVLKFHDFKVSDERFRNYYATGPGKPFCRTYIDPKLRLLKRSYGKRLAR